ncbi:sulfite exporter TauE/SafE family protein [Rhizobium leguminosarum]|uniref:sulfite exporter TauE/SafE family protein n=1 Tax=Rhizobium leguminosarum TaxID=384 RepID=UPI001C96A266|nr:sulfite exporter TauE/SafE family protein [Rhizobium leguminosarum]MBY5410522.1 sulfite exporter TauE/SafE family protein [Rhizobium leguminosarum]
MALDLFQHGMGTLSGALVGFTLALLGGGGSILAVPLLVRAVGLTDAHTAIATSAVAVAANALISLVMHARRGTVIWGYAGLYCATGMVGALLGASIGKVLDGNRLLLYFSGLMIAIAILMLRRISVASENTCVFESRNTTKVLAIGGGSGIVSGFFGIGGGFLIVPGLVFSTGMPTINAVSTSLVAIVTFGSTTAATYSISGLVDWPLAAVFIAGGAFGAVLGCNLGQRLRPYQSVLNRLFAGVVLIFGIAMAWSTLLG